MKTKYFLVAVSICVWTPTLSVGQTAKATETTADNDTRPGVRLVPLTAEQQEKLLKVR